MICRRIAAAAGLAVLPLVATAAEKETILGPDPEVAQILRVDRLSKAVQADKLAECIVMQPGDERLLAETVGRGHYDTLWRSTPAMAVTRHMIARPLAPNGDIRAFFGPGKDSAIQRLGLMIDKTFDDIGVIRFELPEGVDPSAVTTFLMATGDYEYVEPDFLVTPTGGFAFPNDPLFSQQWHHNTNRLATPIAWGMNTGSSDVIIAVCDTGIDFDHPDLSGNVMPGYDAVADRLDTFVGEFTDDNTASFGHGTFVATCAAAKGNNGTGVSGVGWDFTLLPVKIGLTQSGSSNLTTQTLGARWAVDNGARIINVSYEGVTSSLVGTTGAYVKQNNGLLFYAAGNDNALLGFPEWPDVVCVSGTNSADGRYFNSNFGPIVSVSAPGQSVYAGFRGGGYGASTGTSFASPIAAGVAALIMSANPNLSAQEVEDILYATVDDLGTPGRDNTYGRGRVNAAAAVQAAIDATQLAIPLFDSFEQPTLSANTWPISTDVSVVTPPLPAPEGAQVLELGSNATLTSNELRGLLLQADGALISFALLERNVDEGETVTFQYLNGSDVWTDLLVIESDGEAGREDFATYSVIPPADFYRTGVQVRFLTNSADGDAQWFVDAFDIRGADPLTPTFFEPVAVTTLANSATFEPNASASVSSAAADEPSGDASIRIQGTSRLQTRTFDDSPEFMANPSLRLAYRSENAEPGERLVIELFDFNGVTTLATITADTDTENGFQVFETSLTGFQPSFFGTNRVRIQTPDSSGDDAWYIDEFQLGGDYVPVATPGPMGCNPADLALPFGDLDISDVVAFLQFFGANDPAADIAAPFGEFDISDVVGFLQVFGAGCP